MLLALLDGKMSAEQIARLALGQAKEKIAQLTEALDGHCMRDHERFLIRSSLRHLACLQEEAEEMDAEILRRMQTPPFQEAFLLLADHTWDWPISSRKHLGRNGHRSSTFPTAEKMASWAGLVPGNRESAGIKGARHTKGNPYLRSTLVQSAWAASQKTRLHIPIEISRTRPRRGPKRAIVAIAHQMLTRPVLHAEEQRPVPWLQIRRPKSIDVCAAHIIICDA